MNIRTKLISLFLILSLIPMVIISIYSTKQTGIALQDKTELYLKSEVRTFEMFVNQEIGGRNLTAFLKKAVIQNITKKAEEEQYFDSGYLSIVNLSGEIIYHPNQKSLGSDWSNNKFLQDVLEIKDELYKFVDVDGYKKVSYVKFIEGLDMILWAVVPESEILKAAKDIQEKLLLSIFLAGIVIVFIAFFFANSISKPLKKVSENITYVAEHLDFTKVKINDYNKRKDEVGSLAKSFTKMINNWETILKDVNQVAKNLLDSGTQLAEASEDSSAASQEVSASIEEVANRASDQTNYLNQANTAVSELITNLNNSSTLGKDAFELANSTLNQAKKGQHSVTNVISQMNSINNVIEQISGVVNNLVNKSSQIGEIVNLIDSIANQTQLLALNAAIEAARAGEAGRGFSVVADEIKQLAEESMKSANKIKDLIKETQEESNKASNAMVIGKKEVATGSEVVDEAGELFEDIIKASEKNLIGTKQTMEALDSAIQIADSIIDKVHEVAGIAEETSASAEEVSASTEEQTATMEQVSASAILLRDMATELKKTISTFKLS